LGQNLVLLRTDGTKVLPRFLRDRKRGPQWWEQVGKFINVGAVFDSLKCADIPELRLPIPPLDEQRAVAHILESLDEKVELNRRMNETLEGIARAIFKSWFVDFNPVRAKMEGGHPYGMDAKTVTLFPESLADSELGPIPEGWKVRSIGDAVVVAGGSTPSTKEPVYWDGPHFFATPKDLAGLESRVLLRTERTISDAGLQRISSGLLPRGTVLLSSRAPIGYVAISEVPVAVNQGFIAMQCNKDLPPFYVMQWAASSVEVFKQNAGGTTFAEINKRSFRPIPVLVPPKPLLDAYEAASKPLYERITASLRESDTLVRLRDVLLPKLISGEVRIRDAEHIAEAAL
jgi:Restriction endonuclease S subunits